MTRPDTDLPLTGGQRQWLHHLRACEAEGKTTVSPTPKGPRAEGECPLYRQKDPGGDGCAAAPRRTPFPACGRCYPGRRSGRYRCICPGVQVAVAGRCEAKCCTRRPRCHDASREWFTPWCTCAGTRWIFARASMVWRCWWKTPCVLTRSRSTCLCSAIGPAAGSRFCTGSHSPSPSLSNRTQVLHGRSAATVINDVIGVEGLNAGGGNLSLAKNQGLRRKNGNFSITPCVTVRYWRDD